MSQNYVELMVVTIFPNFLRSAVIAELNLKL